MRTIILKKHFDMKALNGTTPLPVNVTLIDKVTKDAQPQYVQSAQNLPPDLRHLIDFVDRQSLSSPIMPFREVGALAYYDKEGILRASWHTSNKNYHINAKDAWGSLFAIPLFDDIDAGYIPERLIHIHTMQNVSFR